MKNFAPGSPQSDYQLRAGCIAPPFWSEHCEDYCGERQASTEMCEGRRAQMSAMNQPPSYAAPPSLALPSPALKRGTFYFAKKRIFLFCIDRQKSRHIAGKETSESIALQKP